MTTCTVNGCAAELVSMNGRALRDALKRTGETLHASNHERAAATSRVPLCPACNAGLLSQREGQWPFQCSDGVMRVCSDLEPGGQSPTLTFATFRFSRAALDNAIALFVTDDEKTRAVQAQGRHADADAESALRFSAAVCDWGGSGGGRVWGNLRRRNPDQHAFASTLRNWFHSVRNKADDEAAIAPGLAIAGLGVSFASKHLRLMAPERFAVLDEVLSLGLGFALTSRGYRFFMSELRELREREKLPYDVATIEMGLFNLVRQEVRAKNADADAAEE